LSIWRFGVVGFATNIEAYLVLTWLIWHRLGIDS
jgi:hypothetical protein